MIRIVLLVLFTIFFSSALFAQNVDKLYRIIENKLNEDKSYLDLKSFNFTPNEEEISQLGSIPRFNRGSFSFQEREGLSYEIVFLDETVEFDSLTLVRINKVDDRSVTGETGVFEGAGASTMDTTVAIISFRDIQELYFSNQDVYYKLIDKLYEFYNEREPRSKLGISSKIREDIRKGRGISATNNQDYLDFAYTNSDHYYPPPPSETETEGFVRGGARASEEMPYKVSFDFNRLTFYNTDFLNLDDGSIHLEANTVHQLLNLQPWQPMTLNFGIRTFIQLSDKKITEDKLIDAKLLGRFRINTSSFNYQIPHFFIEPSNLNLTSGVIVDLSTTRMFGFPFMNFYYSIGSEDLSNPYVSSIQNNVRSAYFSTKQWAFTFSFYWNSSEERTLRFRIDTGIGQFNVIRATYGNPGTSNLVYNQIQPFVKLYMNFVPRKDNELFHTNIRVFDSVLKFNFWLKLFEIDPHLFRLEASYMSEPLFRDLRTWEVESSSYVGIKYKLGF